ncbi:hypothetical protein [Paenibacillus naphthalenovorans]|uniref:hypothetical protein n=1 Tax=Paenibacillus naphthalenovorans TaxID=162209 RepID=UPI00088B74C7|nr:hypothetical protein [Paenibacillus naphthalenovorans]SDJ61308.1 hypothetical protein SAMN05421868_13440 [Paenibacillus naphthalenovorans]
MAHPNEEKETTCIYDYTSKEWIVYTCVPRHITKLMKSCGEPFWKEEEENSKGESRIVSGKWKLQSSQVRFYGPYTPKEDDEQDEEVEDTSSMVQEV